MPGSHRLRLASIVVAALAAAPAAQRRGPPSAAPVPADPYTRDAAVAASCGHATKAPFRWADRHTTGDIEQLLGNIPLRWVETAHFRLGSTLPSFDVQARDKRCRRKLVIELTRLRDKLPAVDPRTRTLDPWLRIHLFAQRVEDLYADFSRRIGVTDADFRGAERLGKGAFLGMPDKYTVLLLAKESSMSRYTQRFLGRDMRVPVMHKFAAGGSLFFGAAAEHAKGALADDTFMHCTVVYGVVNNLIDGYRFYGHAMPPWFKTGLGQWYLRRVDPRYNNFASEDQNKKPDSRTTGWDWQPRVRGLVANDNAAPTASMLASTALARWKFADYMLAWSRVDFLISRGDAGLAKFLRGMKTPFHSGRRLPSDGELLLRQQVTLQNAWGLTPARLDVEWRAWVLATYSKRARKRLSTENLFLHR